MSEPTIGRPDETSPAPVGLATSVPEVISPLAGLEKPLRALGKPASRGFALALVVLNLIVVGWMFNRQSEALDDIRSDAYSSVPLPASPADPELCWVMGANAYAMGRGAELSHLLSTAPAATDCVIRAQRGALGKAPE